MTDKVKTLNQVVEEFYKDGEDEVANFKTRLATARDRLKDLQKDPEMILPQGIWLKLMTICVSIILCRGILDPLTL